MDIEEAAAAVLAEILESLFERDTPTPEPLPDCFGVDPAIHPGDPFREPRYF